MVKFIPVQCPDYEYPSYIDSKIQERTANFFRENIEKTNLDYISLHTDHPMFWKKKQRDKILSSNFLKEFPSIFDNIYDSGYYCFSKLWCDDKGWSKDFARFLLRLTDGIESKRIKIIEIHPPFKKYCDSFETFIERYKPFEEEILKKLPSTKICIENRYNNSKTKKISDFMLSTTKDIIDLTELISNPKNNLNLTLVVDVPQLFSEHNNDKVISEERLIREVLTDLKRIRNFITYTHIWGRSKTVRRGRTFKGVHNADLNTYFENNEKIKNCFLEGIYDLFDDGIPRYFLPEIYNGNDEMSAEESIKSIVDDLRNYGGIEFMTFE